MEEDKSLVIGLTTTIVHEVHLANTKLYSGNIMSYITCFIFRLVLELEISDLEKVCMTLSINKT